MRKVLVASVLVLGIAGEAHAQRPATFDDVLQVKAVGSPAVSPDGTRVVYTVRQWEPASEREKDRMEARTRIWTVPTDGSRPARQITYGERGDSQPQWSPDGRFISFVVGARRRQRRRGRPAAADLRHARRRRRSAEADQRQGGRDLVLVVARQRAHRLSLARPARRRRGSGGARERDDEKVFEGRLPLRTLVGDRGRSQAPRPGG